MYTYCIFLHVLPFLCTMYIYKRLFIIIRINVYVGELFPDLVVRVETEALADAGCSDVVMTAAAGGDIDTLSSFLKQNPSQVSDLSLSLISDLTPKGREACHLCLLG